MAVPQPWSSVEQAMLVTGLQAGRPPASICRDLGRTHDDVRRRICSLLGDRAGAAGENDLDLLWLRVRGTSVAPAEPEPAEVAALWQSVTGVVLSPEQAWELGDDPAVPALAAAGRYALLVTAPGVLAGTGLLDLGDWLDAATGHDAAARLLPARPDGTRTATLLRLVAAVVEDVAPAGPRRALRRHLRLESGVSGPPTEDSGGRVGDTHGIDLDDHAARRAAVVDVTRAAGVSGRPAALLRDRLLDERALEALVTGLSVPGFAVATTLATFGGRHESEALRIAGRVLSPWRRPPNLGRGAVVRTTLT